MQGSSAKRIGQECSGAAPVIAGACVDKGDGRWLSDLEVNGHPLRACATGAGVIKVGFHSW
jgi:hypothetical protein